MKREIKFRAWNVEAQKMVDLAEITPLALDAGMNTQLAMQGASGLFIPFIPGMEIMQFTGLKDKNGVEIFEGDILTYEMHQHKHAIKHEDYPRPVRWDDKKAAWFFGEYNLGNAVEYVKSVEIIGNIHQNPELLQPTGG